MLITQAAFYVNHPMGEFVGILVFDGEVRNALECARKAWGTGAEFKELDARELAAKGREGLPIFTHNGA